MWLATRHGFFSIVKKDGQYHIRARSVDDLKNLRMYLGKPSLKIHETPDADYPARIVTPSANMIGDIFIAFAADIQYDNFKGAIARTSGQSDKLPWYHEIWTSMRDWQLRRGKTAEPALTTYNEKDGDLF